MVKLNQIVAVVNGKKTECAKELTELHKKSQHADSYAGLHRSYKPLDEDGEKFPDESKPVQLNYKDVLKTLSETCSDMLNVVATQEYANCEAKSDVTVDGNKVLENVPVSYLLFLDKQLLDLETFFTKLPTLDNVENWVFNSNSDIYGAEPYETTKTKKVLQHKVLYEATEQHPAQIEKWTEDVVVGKWVTRKYSGAIPATLKKTYIDKIKKLREAVKFARESANSIDVNNVEISNKLFNYILA